MKNATQHLSFIILALAALSCSNENISNSILSPVEKATAGVKCIITYPSADSDNIMSIKDYEYNFLG